MSQVNQGVLDHPWCGKLTIMLQEVGTHEVEKDGKLIGELVMDAESFLINQKVYDTRPKQVIYEVISFSPESRLLEVRRK